MILVTGGTGLLGTGLVAHPVERGDRCRALHRGERRQGREALVRPDLEAVEGHSPPRSAAGKG